MALGTLERLKLNDENQNLIPKTIFNGQLKVNNVPHASYPNGLGPDGKKEYIPGDVMYKLTQIFRYMIDKNVNEIDFNNF